MSFKEKALAALAGFRHDSLGIVAATIEDCEQMIREIPEGDGWIPVMDRLPEPGERVLASDGGFVGEFYINGRGQWQRYNVNSMSLSMSLLMALDILWWMQLPEPPEEGKG